MSLITMEVLIDHGTLTAKEPHLLPETGAGLLTIIRSGESPIAARPPCSCHWFAARRAQ